MLIYLAKLGGLVFTRKARMAQGSIPECENSEKVLFAQYRTFNLHL